MRPRTAPSKVKPTAQGPWRAGAGNRRDESHTVSENMRAWEEFRLGLNSHVSGSELTDGGICTTDQFPRRTVLELSAWLKEWRMGSSKMCSEEVWMVFSEKPSLSWQSGPLTKVRTAFWAFAMKSSAAT